MVSYRKIYESQNGPIPKGFHIHHIDGNHNNNHIDNLRLLSAKDHYDIHKQQGDYGACWAMIRTGHLSVSDEERSFVCRQNQLKRLSDGTHQFKNFDWQSKYSKISNQRRLNDGTHNLLDGTKSSEYQRKKLEDGTHHFLDKDWHEKHNLFLQIDMNKKLLEEGKHPSQIIKECPHCGKRCSSAPYTRWHGDKCKHKET